MAFWSIIGTGKVTNKKFDYVDNDSYRMVRTLSGKLQIQVNDFKPAKNIDFGVINNYSFSLCPVICDDEIISIGRDMTLDGDYTKEELKILRNTIYAQYNYDFKTPDLKKYFSQFDWYMPDPNLKMEDIKLTEMEKKYLEEILKREKIEQEK